MNTKRIPICSRERDGIVKGSGVSKESSWLGYRFPDISVEKKNNLSSSEKSSGSGHMVIRTLFVFKGEVRRGIGGR